MSTCKPRYDVLAAVMTEPLAMVLREQASDRSIAVADAIVVRRACESDAPAIRTAVRRERLNPTDLDWRRFFVAEQAGELIACAQMRVHRDGARELGSLLVRPPWRGRGVAGRLIGALLAHEAGPVYMITGRAHAAHYARWGFRPVSLRAAPMSVRRNSVMGRLASVIALIARRRVNRLAILRRNPHRGGVIDREARR